MVVLAREMTSGYVSLMMSRSWGRFDAKDQLTMKDPRERRWMRRCDAWQTQVKESMRLLV